MKRKSLRIVLLVALLGGLAAIPASTQGVLTPSHDVSDDAGVDLQMLLLVNRLELSRQQMETLHSTIVPLSEKADAIEEKQAAFEQEMIAFNGTAAELDARLTAFRDEVKASRTELDQGVNAAIDTLKTTLSMKQGEVLAAAFPGIMGFSSSTPSTSSKRALPQLERLGILKNGRTEARDGRVTLMVRPGPEVSVGANASGPCVVDRLQAMAKRLAQRFSGAAAGAAIGARVWPVGDGTASQTDSEVQGQDAASIEGFGRLGFSVSLGGQLLDAPLRAQRLTSWLERFAEILELKLAAMK